MRKEYSFSKSRKNPYVRRLKKQITIRLGAEVIDYFKSMAKHLDVPYQNLIDLYLRDCAESKRKCTVRWRSQTPRATRRAA